MSVVPYRLWILRAFWLGLFAVAITACRRGEALVDADAGLRNCDEYASAFRACMSRLSGRPEEAAERAAATHAALLSAASHDDAARAAVQAKCASGLEQLRRACP
jgi:hypothetical protein